MYHGLVYPQIDWLIHDFGEAGVCRQLYHRTIRTHEIVIRV